jgi:hypothetical protein
MKDTTKLILDTNKVDPGDAWQSPPDPWPNDAKKLLERLLAQAIELEKIQNAPKGIYSIFLN